MDENRNVLLVMVMIIRGNDKEVEMEAFAKTRMLAGSRNRRLGDLIWRRRRGNASASGDLAQSLTYRDVAPEEHTADEPSRGFLCSRGAEHGVARQGP